MEHIVRRARATGPDSASKRKWRLPDEKQWSYNPYVTLKQRKSYWRSNESSALDIDSDTLRNHPYYTSLFVVEQDWRKWNTKCVDNIHTPSYAETLHINTKSKMHMKVRKRKFYGINAEIMAASTKGWAKSQRRAELSNYDSIMDGIEFQKDDIWWERHIPSIQYATSEINQLAALDDKFEDNFFPAELMDALKQNNLT